MTMYNNEIDLIASLEGFSPRKYWDVKHYSIGFGTKWNESISEPITREKGKILMIEDVKEIQKKIPNLTGRKKEAITSFIYNVGFNAWSKSTLKKKIEANAPREEIETEFRKWNKAGGKVLDGLKKRREEEIKHFFSGVANSQQETEQAEENDKSVYYIGLGLLGLALLGFFGKKGIS